SDRLLEGKKLWEGKPFVHHFKTDMYRDAYMHCLEIITYEITEHVYPAIPELHHDNRIRERRSPRRPSNLRIIDAKCHHLPLARFLSPCGQRSEADLTQWTRRKTESPTMITLLNE
ncbi:MAG TPA: hypothetical protein VLQ80_23450, partial [Candidatus Saccharimonadia bacterium]|nr:hypothetical protein [Candidatus Saccharimonadia bacterium]